MHLLITPGAPFFSLSLAGVIIAALGLVLLEHTQSLIKGMRTIPTRWGMRGRILLGHAAAIPLATLLLLVIVIGGVTGTERSMLLTAALGSYLYLGWSLPRRPLVQAEREAMELRMLTPGFLAYIRVAITTESPAALLERYVVQPSRRHRTMQHLVHDALDVMRNRRKRPFEALSLVTREHSCRELNDVAEQIAQAESEGVDVQGVLEAQQSTLEAILHDEFRRMVQRRTLYLLGMVAVSVVFGILGNLLFVVTGGGSLLMSGNF